MRALALASMLLLAACGASSNHGSTDGGSTDGGASDGGMTDGGSTSSTDGGSTAPACTDGDTQACTGSTEGHCDPGERTCVNGQWSKCDGSQPQPGLCDYPSCAGGPNPGCDCVVGTFQECHSQSSDTLGHGSCTAGFQACVATATGSTWGACEGEVTPLPDDCSGRELNCGVNAATDCTCSTGETRPCGGVTGGTCQLGTQTCCDAHGCDGSRSDGTWGSCAGAVQPVKGDCGDPSCLSTGSTFVPNPGCQCVIGQTEPCYTGPTDTENVGTCAAGTRTCLGSGDWGSDPATSYDCAGEVHPSPVCFAPSCTGDYLPGCQ